MSRKKLHFYFSEGHESSDISDGRRYRFLWDIGMSMYSDGITYTDGRRRDDIETDVIQIDDRGDLSATHGTVGCSISYTARLNPRLQALSVYLVTA